MNDNVALGLLHVSYKDWQFRTSDDPDDLWLQVLIPDGDKIYHGRKWRLSQHMTRSEVVQTALLAVLAAEEHEAREKFTYRGEAIFQPHYNVDDLVDLKRSSGLDVRT